MSHNRLGAEDKKLELKAIAKTGLTKALHAQQPVAVENIERPRRVHSGKSPAELLADVNKIYLAAVPTIGAAAGAMAIVPLQRFKFR